MWSLRSFATLVTNSGSGVKALSGPEFCCYRPRMMRPTLLIGLAILSVTGTYAAETTRESSPGKYSGYSTAVYDGHTLTSEYVKMRDGTRLAIDIFRPTRAGAVATEHLPV